MNRNKILENLQSGKPFDGLGSIQIIEFKLEPIEEFVSENNIRSDVTLTIDFAGNTIKVYGELKTLVTPKLLREIAPWLARIKELNPENVYALICPYVSPRNQEFCLENRIDFIDISGNVSIQVPGKIWIQRLNRPNLFPARQLYRNPFSGASSRVLRVLLQYPDRKWTATGIKEELIKESKKQKKSNLFILSPSSITKTIQSLEEEILIRREGKKILTPEPKQLLFRWAEKYREIRRRTKQKTWIIGNPIGFDIITSWKGLKSQYSEFKPLLTGSAAANLVAPFVNVDRYEIYVLDDSLIKTLQNWKVEQAIGPDFQFIEPYDDGVLMYARCVKGITIASDIQIYFDCYARGGRDLKQAEYLLSNIIEPRWMKK